MSAKAHKQKQERFKTVNQVGQHIQTPSQSSPAAAGLGASASGQGGNSLLNPTGQNNLTGFLSSLIAQLDQANLAGQNKTPELQNKISELQTILQSLTTGTATPTATPQSQNGAMLSPSSLTGLNNPLLAGDAATLAQLQAGNSAAPLAPSLLNDIAGAPSLLNSNGTLNIAVLKDLQTQLTGQIENLDQLVVTPEQQAALQNIISMMQQNGLNIDALNHALANAEITNDPALATLGTIDALSQMSEHAATLIPTANSVHTPNPTSLDQAAATPNAIPGTLGKANAAAGSNLNSVEAQAHNQETVQDESWRLSQNAEKQNPAQAQATKNAMPNMQNIIAAQVQMSQQPAQAQTMQTGQAAQATSGFNNFTAAMDMGQSDLSGQQFGGQGTNDPILQTTLAQQQNAAKAEGTQASQFANYMQNSKAPANAKTIENLSLQIQKGLNSQNNTIKVQLTPLDLGQVDIEMRFTEDGTMQAHMLVEKPETLAMLQKDSSALEQSLKNAGIELDNDSLHFDLRQQHAKNDNDFANNGANKTDNNGINGKGNDQMVEAEIAVETYEYVRADGVNIWV